MRDAFKKLLLGVNAGIIFGIGSIVLIFNEPLYVRISSDDIKIFTRTSNNENDTEDITEAQRLYRDVRVLCWVLTHPGNLKTKAKAVQDTWAKRCNTVLFMSDETDESFPAVGLGVQKGRKFLTFKSIKAFQYVFKHHLQDADWFLKADDDTYVIMENLRYLLSSYDPHKPVYLGRPFGMYLKQGYMSGGAGYVLSKAALENFVSSEDLKCKRDDISEDLNIGRCMETLGIPTFDARDKFGKTRFHFKDATYHLKPNKDKVMSSWDAYGGITGKDNLSDYPVTFHYVLPEMMLQMEYFVYHLKPYGIQPGLPSINGPLKTIDIDKPGRYGKTAK